MKTKLTIVFLFVAISLMAQYTQADIAKLSDEYKATPELTLSAGQYLQKSASQFTAAKTTSIITTGMGGLMFYSGKPQAGIVTIFIGGIVSTAFYYSGCTNLKKAGIVITPQGVAIPIK